MPVAGHTPVSAIIAAPARLTAKRPGRTRGFTIIELLVVVILTGILTSAVMPKFREALSASRIGRVSRAVASDLDVGVSLAARQRRPVRIECDCPNRMLRVVDRASGAVLHQRSFAGAQDLSVGSMSLAASDGNSFVVVFPNGIASSQLTVTLGDGTRQRQVILSLSGSVRTS